MNIFLRICGISVLLLFLTGCATTKPKTSPQLIQGKHYFVEGYYKRSLCSLLPLAADGNAEAQYTVGYLYYYGYGVTQDTEVGYFWIKRSADQHYPPALKALALIAEGKSGK